MQPLTGDDPVEIAGYRLRARLGTGGMGRVYLAFTPAGRPVALKVIRPEFGDDSEFRRRFRQEAQAARRVHGIYTAQVLDADPDAVPPWLVTAYVAGPSLHEAVTGHGPMPEQTVFVLLAGVAEALSAIHATGIVHRDLKPSNVLLAPDGPRVIDFGIARAMDGTALTLSGTRVGSPQFMAPEQVLGQEITAAVDVFALGALGAFAALGRPVFGAGEEMAMLYRVVHAEPDLGDCPPALHDVLSRCLAKEPGARPEPAEVVALCRERAAELTGVTERSWLPPAVAETLVQHTAPRASLGGPSAEASADDGTRTVIPPSMFAAGASPADTRAPATTPALLAPREERGSPVPGPARVARLRHVPLWAAIGGGLAVAGVAVLAAVLVVTLSGTGTPAKQAGAPTPSLVTSHSASAPASAHATAKPVPVRHVASVPPAVDPCVVGTWRDTADDLQSTISGETVHFTASGPGDTLVIHANGAATETWKDYKLTTTEGGNQWAIVDNAKVGMHLNSRGGFLLISAITTRAGSSYTYYENGAYNSSGVFSLEIGSQPYVCSGNVLRWYEPNGSQVYERE